MFQESLKKVLQEKLEAIQKLTEIEVCVMLCSVIIILLSSFMICKEKLILLLVDVTLNRKLVAMQRMNAYITNLYMKDHNKS